ncbi:hypothetical protein, partial [Dialister sp.]|uniref:hypothetical protein n=1 Tax=Dialister sp. TaxID=1955814 RepID=UPI003F002FFF
TEPQSAVLAASPHPPHMASYDRRHMTLFIVPHHPWPVKGFSRKGKNAFSTVSPIMYGFFFISPERKSTDERKN